MVLQECLSISSSLKYSSEEAYLFSLALKLESNMVGRECIHLGISNCKQMKQCSYEGDEEAKVDTVFESILVSTTLVPIEVEI